MKGVCSGHFCSDIPDSTAWNTGQGICHGEEGVVCQSFKQYTEYHGCYEDEDLKVLKA